jgi:ketosteroid isomerase-like protein
MSQEDVEVVRRLWDVWEKRHAEAVMAFYDEEIVWDLSRAHGNVVLSDEYRGHDGVRQFFRDWAGSFEDYFAHAEQFTDGGDGQVVVRARQGGRGRQSGADLDMRYWQVFRLKGGRVVRVEVYSEESEALEAVGLA